MRAAWRMMVALGAVFCAAPAEAACRLALLLAMDVSNSVNAREDHLQRTGMAEALLAPEVQRAAFATDQSIAIAAFEWSGRHHQQMLLDWTTVTHPSDLERAAATIRNSTRGQIDFPTAMGHALKFAAQTFETAPNCLFQTLDVAGDGKSNTGFSPQSVLESPAFNDITVNGLVVRVLDLGMDLGVPAYYEANVKHGPGAFIEVAEGFEDYERAMRRKLQRELSPPVLGAVKHEDTAG